MNHFNIDCSTFVESEHDYFNDQEFGKFMEAQNDISVVNVLKKETMSKDIIS